MVENSGNIAVKYTDIEMQEKIKTIKEETRNSIPYVSCCVSSQLERLSLNQHDASMIWEYAKGSCLIHNPIIQKYTVIKHYYLTGKGDIYVVAETKDSLYGFLVDINGFARLGIFDKKGFQKELLDDSIFIGKTLAEIANKCNIPLVSSFLYLFN